MILLTMIGVLIMVSALLYAMIHLAALTGLTLAEKRGSQPGSGHSSVSVILPVRNEAVRILGCLESLALQDYPPERFEVVISDDHSDDATLDVVFAFIKKHPLLRCRIVTAWEEGGRGIGKKVAIARALQSASGDLILTTDADTDHSPSWISSMVSCYDETGARMILGPVMFSDSPGFFGKIQILEFLGIMGFTSGFARIGKPLMCNGANLCFEKKLFEEVGGYSGNETYASGDDQFLLWKVKQRYGGRSIRFLDNPEGIVTTTPEPDLISFLRQRFRWVSKSRGYKDPLVLAVGAVTYFFQLMVIAMVSLTFLSPLYLYLAGLLFCFKLLIDLPLLFSMSRFFGTKNLWLWYIPAQLFQILYITFSGPLALMIPVKWKGRRV